MVSYTVTVVTKNSVYNAYESRVCIQLIGDPNISDIVTLKPADDIPVDPDNYILFQAGRTDVFNIETKSIDDVKQIKIGFNDNGFVEGWSPRYVEIENLSTSKKSYFPHDGNFNKWKNGILTLNATDKVHPGNDDINFIMGPILGCRALSVQNEYQLCALLVTPQDQNPLPYLTFTYVTVDHPDQTTNGESDDVMAIAGSKDRIVWRYDWSVPWHETKEGICTYTIPDGRSFTCYIPCQRSTPRFVFASCAGLFPLYEIPDTPKRNIMWQHMRNEHRRHPVHLLIMGGDQIYADNVFNACPSLVKWSNLSREEREIAPLTDEMKDEIDEYFFNLYCTRWREPEPAWMYARVPSIMMWDDHEIIDGYGSRKMCPVFDGIYDIGRSHMLLFQLRCLRDVDMMKGEMALKGKHCLGWLTPWPGNDALDLPLSYYVRYGDIAFLMLDLRSERTPRQVLSEDSWQRVILLLDSIEGVQHIFITVTTPLIFPSAKIPYRVLRIIPGIQELEDDYLDQWDTTKDRRKERDRFFSIMVKFSEKKKTKVSVLSGDVHMACWGKLHTESGTVINIPTSSAIVNKPPPDITLPFYYLGSYNESVNIPGVGKGFMSMPPVGKENDSSTFLATQNFMIFTPATTAEGKLIYITKLIGKPNNLYNSNSLAPPLVFTNHIGPF
ncbi:uncharacterized protein LOC100367586, partial [Saccoglossus kowalevskii]